MAEWDRKFARMVAETERHLSSVKSQLDSRSSNTRPSEVPRRTSSKRSGLVSPYLTKSQSTPLSILKSSTARSKPTLSPAMSSLHTPPSSTALKTSLHSSSGLGVRRNVSFETSPPPPPSTVTSSNSFTWLSEKIRDQQKDMLALRDCLNTMEMSVKQQHGQILSLKDDMHVLQLKVSESELSFSTGRKLQLLKQEILSEVQALERKVNTLSARSIQHHLTSTKVSSPTDLTRLQRSEEINSLRQEITILKSKLATQESKVVGVASSVREARKCQEHTSKMLSEVRGRWSVASECKSQLREIRDMMAGLSARLNSVEAAVFLSSSTNRSTPIPSHDRNHTHFSRSKPMTLNDLNISPISTMATKPRPTLEGKRSNPLHTVPFRPDQEGACSLDDVDLSHTSLSGHTLSCSLELMSDDLDGSEELHSDVDLDFDLASDTESSS